MTRPCTAWDRSCLRLPRGHISPIWIRRRAKTVIRKAAAVTESAMTPAMGSIRMSNVLVTVAWMESNIRSNTLQARVRVRDGVQALARVAAAGGVKPSGGGPPPLSSCLKALSMFAQSVLAFTLGLAMVISTPLYAGNGPGAAKNAQSSLSLVEIADLQFMREEEKLARDVYLNLHETWGLSVFSNIASSEQSHMDAVLKLLRTYRLADPAAGMPAGTFSDASLQLLFDEMMKKGRLSMRDALKVGGIIEETDIRDLAGAIDRNHQTDIDATYGNLLCGSRNHLRSFAHNLQAMTGQPYAAQVIAQDAVNAILASPQERCGQR